MTYIPELHESIENIPESAKEYFSDELKQRMKKFLSDALDDEFQKADDYCNEFLTHLAATRAEDFLKRVLNGDEDAAKRLFESEHDGGRTKFIGIDADEPWAHIINGSLFETGSIALRRKLCEAHPELLQNERIKDLESIVDGLTRQIIKLKAENDKLFERLRH